MFARICVPLSRRAARRFLADLTRLHVVSDPLDIPWSHSLWPHIPQLPLDHLKREIAYEVEQVVQHRKQSRAGLLSSRRHGACGAALQPSHRRLRMRNGRDRLIMECTVKPVVRLAPGPAVNTRAAV
jgi:hypothetical protein